MFLGAFGALVVMTVLSSLIGFALPNLLPKQYTHYAAAILFLYFGCVCIDLNSAESSPLPDPRPMISIHSCWMPYFTLIEPSVKLVYDAWQMEPDEVSEELQEVP